jgi:hypothetical protein
LGARTSNDAGGGHLLRVRRGRGRRLISLPALATFGENMLLYVKNDCNVKPVSPTQGDG